MVMWDEASQFDRVSRAERLDANCLRELWAAGGLIGLGPAPTVAVAPEAGLAAADAASQEPATAAAGQDWLVKTASVLAAAREPSAPAVRLARRPTAGTKWDPVRHLLVGRVGTTALFADLSECAGAEAAVLAPAANASENLADGAGPAAPSQLDLRKAIPLLPTAEAEAAVSAVALANWHRLEGFCPACGAATAIAAAGAWRWCASCQRELFPRTDPAVIVAVVDEADRLLLAHQAVWGANRYSVLAGFVEAGESLEQAVRREVAEEVGVRLGAIRYVASQPWPMPRSLMLGFTARAVSDRLVPDGEEIASARWFERSEMPAAVDSGAVQLPGPSSIAFRLISSWLAGR
ncbi:MAG: NAD(+) diphosphatase [Propionibacteriaceae bacterium]|jgi:NAD+ diphosphatase|nr:NAD(+) diphosphatase [Propionibacteriaceae bacterium]